jgi:tRNA/rRNA methyltransferase
MKLRVVLVEPMYEGNVGSVARAMKNFGFHELVLVNPCKIEDFGKAMASHASDVLHEANSYSTLIEALQGANLVVGTTGKRLEEKQHHLRLHLRVPCLTPANLGAKLQGKDGTIALVLGREDCGLNSEELAICDMVVSIPTGIEYPVMNGRDSFL